MACRVDRRSSERGVIVPPDFHGPSVVGANEALAADAHRVTGVTAGRLDGQRGRRGHHRGLSLRDFEGMAGGDRGVVLAPRHHSVPAERRLLGNRELHAEGWRLGLGQRVALAVPEQLYAFARPAGEISTRGFYLGAALSRRGVECEGGVLLRYDDRERGGVMRNEFALNGARYGHSHRVVRGGSFVRNGVEGHYIAPFGLGLRAGHRRAIPLQR